MNIMNTKGLGKCLEDMKKLSNIPELKNEIYDFQLDENGRHLLKVNGLETNYLIDEQGYLINNSSGELNIIDWILMHDKDMEKKKALDIAFKYHVPCFVGSYNPNTLANYILQRHQIIYCNEDFYIYKNGVYLLIEPVHIERFIKHILRDFFCIPRAKETLHSLQTASVKDYSQINPSNLINLKNGMYELESEELKEHSPLYYSTIQHNFEYDPRSTCLLWERTLNEIFDSDRERIELLQEYMGLCLTRETKYEKALFCYGDGANGKSVVLHILVKLVGEVNCSTIPLEKFDDLVCRIQMENKLVNISVETKAKLKLSDSSFKAITSGEPVAINPKYKTPRSMYPFCKPVFSSNNMFYTTDHTDAVFRRIIILPFKNKFDESIANRDLKYQLEEELPGIFVWALKGLKRLTERGGFSIPKSIQLEMEEFKKDNMPILQFVEERCEISVNNNVTIANIYEEYKYWCKENNHRSTSKRTFVRELITLFKNKIEKCKVNSQRGLKGIVMLPDEEETLQKQLRDHMKILE